MSVLLSILWLHMVAGKSSEPYATITRPMPPSEWTTHPSTCSISRDRLLSNNIVLTPDHTEYVSDDSVQVSCAPGFYLQRPLRQIFFNYTCIAGQWTHAMDTLPHCAASCQEWNTTSLMWQSIRISDLGTSSGLLHSPGYPASIINAHSNCSFYIDTRRSTVKLVSVSMHIVNYILVINADQGRVTWPGTNDTTEALELTGLTNVTITLQRMRRNGDYNLGKAENFKIMYKFVPSVCKIYGLTDLVMVNTSRNSGGRVVQRYWCQYPYTLVGPEERGCTQGAWHPLVAPRCEFLCDTTTKVQVNATLRIQVSVLGMVKCRIKLTSSSEASVLKIKLDKPSSSVPSYCISIRSESRSVDCAVPVPKNYFVQAPATITYVGTRVPLSDTDMIEIQIERRPVALCPTFTHGVGNGRLIYQHRTVSSIGQVQCQSSHYWLGPPKIVCILTEEGDARWDLQKQSDCIKICSNKIESHTISKDQFSVKLPSFLHKKGSVGQICRWEITSRYYNPIIEITSSEDLRKFSNISVTFQKPTENSQVYLHQKFFTDERSFKMIFMCPDKVCVLNIIPVGYISAIPSELILAVIVKLNDKPVSVDHGVQMWITVTLMIAASITISVVLFIDYWRHPYTGFTAKFITLFRRDQLHKLSALFVFEAKPTKDYSKTEADIIIFYNRYHPDSRAVCIRRSFPTIETSDSALSPWKYRFSSVRRRFSDITDMVMYACTVRSPGKPVGEDIQKEDDVGTDPR